ncbi:MAG: AAA family ATPase [Planctomycetota bacterium]|nr:AAA family ATPase [Planctomycetota bacterium]
MTLDRTFHILLVSDDRALESEVGAALATLPGVRAVTVHASTLREAVETARTRQPDVVIFQMDSDIEKVRTLTRDMAETAPGARVIAAYRRDAFPDPEAESGLIIQALRAQVLDFLRMPISAQELRQLLERLFRTPHRTSGAAGLVTTFFSHKGGVGKSTLAVNTACLLARRHPDRVLLVDASLQLGVCAPMLDLEPDYTVRDAAGELDRLDATLLQRLTARHPSGLHLLAAPSTLEAATEIDDRALARILALARRSYDHVVVDTFPLLDAVVLGALDLSDTAVIVTSPAVPVVTSTAHLLETLVGVGIDRNRLALVLNQSHPTYMGQAGPADVAARTGFDVEAVVAFDRRVPASQSTGQPTVLATRGRSFRRGIARIADFVEARRPVAMREAPTADVESEREPEVQLP